MSATTGARSLARDRELQRSARSECSIPLRASGISVKTVKSRCELFCRPLTLCARKHLRTLTSLLAALYLCVRACHEVPSPLASSLRFAILSRRERTRQQTELLVSASMPGPTTRADVCRPARCMCCCDRCMLELVTVSSQPLTVAEPSGSMDHRTRARVTSVVLSDHALQPAPAPPVHPRPTDAAAIADQGGAFR